MQHCISSSFRKLGFEEMKKERLQALEAIGLDSKEVLLLLLLMQKLIVQVTALKPLRSGPLRSRLPGPNPLANMDPPTKLSESIILNVLLEIDNTLRSSAH